ncbi:MAG: hypothetical protein ACYS8X_09095 [Planctomycetota bacterium]|jgi:tetratricopeptide (TPR) repeat protein
MRPQVIVLLIMALGFGVAMADGPAAEPLPPTPEEIEELLTPLVQAIEQAKTPAEALSAYGEAGKIARGDRRVNEAQLRKMLTFGQVQNAVYAARALLQFNDQHGLAWGVVGYYEAARGYFSKALPAAVRAAELLPGDPGVMHNLGLLLAWYDSQEEPPRLTGRIRRAVVLNQDRWAKNAAFAEGYQQTMTLFSAADEEIDLIDERLEEVDQQVLIVAEKVDLLIEKQAPIELELCMLKRQLYTVDMLLVGKYWTVAQLRGKITHHNKAIRKLEAVAEPTARQEEELARLKEEVTYWEADIEEATNHKTKRQLRDRIFELRDDIRFVQREWDELEASIRVLNRKGRGLLAERRDLLKDLKELDGEKRKTLRTADTGPQWELPLVDGRRIDVAAARKAVGKLAAKERRANAAPKPVGMVKLARQYLAIKKTSKAVELLEKVIEIAPESDSAAEAKTILDDLAKELIEKGPIAGD